MQSPKDLTVTAASPAAAGTERTVLIVDDHPANLQVAVRLLEGYGLTVLIARDGETGLRRAKLARPRVILLDVQLPGIDGYEVCRRLRADPAIADIPVIFMTVLDKPVERLRGFEVGGVDFVTKPVEERELVARVQAHVQIRELRAELARHAEGLEARVAERTAALEAEVARRVASEREREQLLELVRLQGEQLRDLTRRWIEEEKGRDRGVGEALREAVGERLVALGAQIDRAGRGAPAELAAQLQGARAVLDEALERTRSLSGSLADDHGLADARENDPLLKLSPREYEVLQLLAAGKANKQIAQTLDVARTTVSTLRTRILEKLGVDDLASLVRLVERRGSNAA